MQLLHILIANFLLQMFLLALSYTILISQILIRVRNGILSIDLDRFGSGFLSIARDFGVEVTFNNSFMVAVGVRDVIQGGLLGLAGISV